MRTAGRAGNRPRAARPNLADLRRAYFAQAGDIARRYGVDFDQVIDHVHAARANHARGGVPDIRHMDDLVHAVACVADRDLAWWDLTEEHELALVRMTRQWLEPTDSIVFVRRLLAALRREDDDLLSLRRFDGVREMRRWLADRIVGRMNTVGGGLVLNASSDVRSPGRAADGGQRPPVRRRLLDGHVLEGNVIWRQTGPVAAPWDPGFGGRTTGASG
jgi:hypothetical protein